jgi:hypothetical protein
MVLLDLAKQFMQRIDFPRRQAAESIDDPAFMLIRHVCKGLAAARSQPDPEGTAVAGNGQALNQTFSDKLVRDTGDVAASDHHAARQLFHFETILAALELRHQVKAG